MAEVTEAPKQVTQDIKPTESAVPPGNGAAPKEEEVSSKFAALAKKDKAISRRAQEMAAKEQAIKEREQKLQAENLKFEELRNKARMNPIDAMKELGLTYEQVTEFILNKEKPTADSKLEMLRQELEAFRNETKTERQKAEEQIKKHKAELDNQAVDSFKSSIEEFIHSAPEDYELLNQLDNKGLINAKELIFMGIQRVHRDHGRIPSIKEASDGVQAYLLQELESLIDSVKHFKGKYSKAAPEKTPDGATPTTTLSNSMGTSMASQLPAATDEERVQRALRAMEQHA